MNDPCCTGELESPLAADVRADLARRLGALADPARVQIVAILAAARDAAMSTHVAAAASAGAAPGDQVPAATTTTTEVAPGSVCACDFVAPLGKSQPTVSHHLKVLSNAGLVVGERHGRWIWYHLADEGVADLADHLRSIGIVGTGD